MRKELCCLLAVLIVTTFALELLAEEPKLSVSDIYNDNGYLCIDFRLYEGIDSELLNGLRDGIPAQLRYRIDIWLDRSNWSDKLVKSVSLSYRIDYDNWDTLFCVTILDDGSETTTGRGDVAALIHLVCNQQRIKICPLDALDSLADYYVTISAEVKSLSADRVREIDSWLGGNKNDKGGGLLGFIVGLFRSKTKSARTKSRIFSLKGLSR